MGRTEFMSCCLSHPPTPLILQSAIQVVLKTLNDIMSHGVEIQLKILQTILPLLTNYNVHKESLAEVSCNPSLIALSSCSQISLL